MNRITIGFSRSKSRWMVMSTLICWALKRDYSHVYVRFADMMTERQLVFEASLGMVHFNTYEDFIANNYVAEEWYMDADNAHYSKLYNFMLDQLEVRYGFVELLWNAIKLYTGVRVVSGDGLETEICSELGDRACEVLGLNVPGNPDYETPSALEKFCSMNMKQVKE